MSQGDQLDAWGWDRHWPVAHQAVQEVAHIVLCAVWAIDVQRLEYCVGQTLQVLCLVLDSSL